MKEGKKRRGLTERSRRSVARILDAAAGLFGQEGFDRATMTDVARAAGVSKGLLHYHFDSKEHLLLEALRSVLRQLRKRFGDRLERGEHGLDTALEALDALWEAVFEMRGWAPFMVETMSLARQNATVRADLEAFYAEADDALIEAIEGVFADRREQLALPPQRLSQVIRTCLHGLVVELARAQTAADTADVDRAYRDLREQFARIVYVDDAHADQEGA